MLFMKKILLFVLIPLTFNTFSQPFDPALFNSMKYRMIGPYRGGRTVGGTGVPSQPNVFYIGALGSKKTQGSRMERLKTAGFDEAALVRIHSPIGLKIGAVGAPEIAISIMAEMTQSLRLGG